MSREFLHAVNWFRGVAIIFVVASHLNYRVLQGYWFEEYLKAFFYNGTAFFIFIAGYLFWHLIARFEYRHYLESKVKNVLVPYALIMTGTIMAVYVLGTFGINSIDFTSEDYKVQISNPLTENGFVWHFLKGGAINFPLWFIPMITIFFLASWLLKAVSESGIFAAVLVVALGATFLTTRGEWAPLQFVHYLGVYLFGIFCRRNQSILYANAKPIAAISLPFSIIFVYFKVNFTTTMPAWDTGAFFGMVNYSEIQKMFSILFFLSTLMSRPCRTRNPLFHNDFRVISDGAISRHSIQ